MTEVRLSANEVFRQRCAKALKGCVAWLSSASAVAVKCRIMATLFAVVLASMVGVGWSANQNIHAESESERKKAHTLVIIQKLTNLLSSLKDAETGQRGYIITGKQEYLKPYYASLNTVSMNLAELRRLTADDPGQQQRLADLTLLVAEKLKVLKATIKMREGNGFSAARELLMTLAGQRLMDDIRVLVGDAEATESGLLKERIVINNAASLKTDQSIFLGSTLGVFAMLLLLICLRWEMRNRRLADGAWQTSEAQYRGLFNSIEEGFCVIEMVFDAHKKPIDYRFLEVNPAFERQTGMRDVVGRRMLELVPDHDLHWFESCGKVALTGESHRFAKETKALDDRSYDVYAFRLGGVESSRVAVLFNDVTGRRQTQEKILRLNAGLEARVRQRTGHLEAINNELESFSYSVSHDLRSPLNTIVMFSHLLEKTLGDKAGEKGTHYLSRIHNSTRQMGELIDGLMSLGNLSHVPLKIESVDLSEIAKQKMREHQEQEPGRRTQIRIQDGMLVNSDPRMMAIIIQNLLGNAWKFTSMRALTQIEIGSQTGQPRQAGAVDETVYFFRDNGAGFDMTNAQKLFGAFERLHSSSDFSGTGIGLATVKRVIERHGGRIWAEGTENVGATFYFTLKQPVV